MAPRVKGTSEAEIAARKPYVDAFHRLSRNFERRVGGGAGTVGVYGCVSQRSIEDIMLTLVKDTGFCKHSVFLDAGHGLFKPGLHAMIAVGVYRCLGFEIDYVKNAKAKDLVTAVFNNPELKPALDPLMQRPELIEGAADQMASDLRGATHLWTFWESWSPVDKAALGRLVRGSLTLKAIVIIQPAVKDTERQTGPERAQAKLEDDLCFGKLELVQALPVCMEASSQAMTAYIFTRQPCVQAPGGCSGGGVAESMELDAANEYHDYETEAAAAQAAAAAAAATHTYATRKAKPAPVPAEARPPAGQAWAKRVCDKFIPVFALPEFEVSPLAKVRRVSDGKVLASKAHNAHVGDYISVDLNAGSWRRKVPLARLVAVTFAAQLPGAVGKYSPQQVMEMLGLKQAYKSGNGKGHEARWRIGYADGDHTNCELRNLRLVQNA